MADATVPHTAAKQPAAELRTPPSGEWSDRHATEIWAAAAFAGPAVAGLLSLGRPTVQDGHASLLLVLVVALVSASGLRAAGVVAAVTSALAYDYSWTEPYGSLAIHGLGDVITVLLLLAVAVASGQLSWWAARQQAAAAQQRGHLAALRLAAASGPDGAVGGSGEAVCEAVARVLEADRCWFVQGEPPPAAPRLEADGTLTREGRRLDVDRWGLPTDDVIVVDAGTGSPAHYEVSAAGRVARPTLEQRQVAALLARLGGAHVYQPR